MTIGVQYIKLVLHLQNYCFWIARALRVPATVLPHIKAGKLQ